MLKGKCRNCSKVCGFKANECRKCKGDPKAVPERVKGTMLAIVAPTKCAISGE